MVDTLLLRSSLRFYRHHPTQLGLAIVGILLGVAVVTAVLITNASSRKAFELSASTITGTATHQIIGAENGVPQSFYTTLRRRHHYPMAPVIEGYIKTQDDLLTLIGIDPFADAGLRQSTYSLIQGDALQLFGASAAVLISELTLQRLELINHTELNASSNGITKKIKIAGVYRSQNPAATDGLLIADIATAQSLLDRGTSIDRIDLILTEPEVQTLAAELPASLRLIPSSNRAKTMLDMTHGFQINLTAMSLLALLVGAFLIHNTMTFSILQRRELFATLRIVGVTSTGVFKSILIETLLISSIGSLLGISAGYFIAHYLIQLTTLTINDLYFVLHVQQVWLTPSMAIALFGLGVFTSLLAATASAMEAAMLSPVHARMRSRLEARAAGFLPLIALAGAVLMGLGVSLALLPTQSLIVGFAALMALIVGYGFIIPWAVGKSITLLRDQARFRHHPSSRNNLGLNLLTAFSVGGIQRSLSRTGVAIAAVCIAVSATFGVDIMISSFRSTVAQWLETTLQSDIYISVESNSSTQADGVLDAQWLAALQQIESVNTWSSGRARDVITSAGDVTMRVLQPHADGVSGYDFVEGDPTEIWQTFLQLDSVLISEPLATKHALSRGDEIKIFTQQNGDSVFSVAGVYKDYGSSHGRLTMSRTIHDRHWQERSISSIGIKLESGASLDTTLVQVRALLREYDQQLLVRSNQQIRERSLEVFDQTFKVTQVLRLITMGVAFIGIFSALLALQMERAKEFAVLRASGASPYQVATVVMLQTVLMGIIAGLLALPLGWIMSEVLIKVINVRSFGWSMHSLLPAGAIVSTLALAILSACLAGIYPAWRLSTQAIANQLRDE